MIVIEGMLTRKEITHIKSLHHIKYRDKFGEFIVEGPKLVVELLKSGYATSRVFATEGHVKIIGARSGSKLDITIISDAELGRISHLKSPNGILAVVKKPSFDLNDLNFEHGFLLMLDGISDPGNLGTIIRTAEWFGIRNIICSENCVEMYNPKVVQSTMGSLFRSRIYYTNLVDLLSCANQKVPVYGTFLDGENIYNQDFRDSGIFIIGSESHGISPEVEKLINRRIHIPSFVNGAESLNASVAAAICCSEIRRNELKNI